MFTSGGITILSFAVVLGLLVFVHELGHFATAKWSDIRVEEFGFGMPPRMLTIFRRGETAYTLNWLPLGGFVRMQGENGEDVEDQRSFAAKSKTVRAIVLAAGSIMNLALAVLLFAAIAMVVGVQDGTPTGFVEIVNVEAGSPAEVAGLQTGDLIMTVDGSAVGGQERLTESVRAAEGRAVEIEVMRGDETVALTVTPERLDGESTARIGTGIVDQRELVRYNPIQALGFGVRQTWGFLVLMVQAFGELFSGIFGGGSDVPVAGPVGIMQATGEIARTGRLENLLGFAAILSINLALINMVPFPALDGGRLVFVIVEALRGKRVSPEREGLVHLFGMLLLLGFIAFISIIDIQRLLGGVSVLQ